MPPEMTPDDVDAIRAALTEAKAEGNATLAAELERRLRTAKDSDGRYLLSQPSA